MVLKAGLINPLEFSPKGRQEPMEGVVLAAYPAERLLEPSTAF
jgi:hypothetical protein